MYVHERLSYSANVRVVSHTSVYGLLWNLTTNVWHMQLELGAPSTVHMLPGLLIYSITLCQ